MNYNRNLRVFHSSTDLDDTMDIIHTVHPPNRFEGRQTQNQSSTNLIAPTSRSPSNAEHFFTSWTNWAIFYGERERTAAAIVGRGVDVYVLPHEREVDE
ncbi:hypothetical protein LOK49_LG09G02394 [Camellia lanceoleosa]|uniref:Uncharacterized protein n=1 Tax=Camellia lanceoleosa TaxID=1840588 RepID=A0ACC0GIT4_9ERIC|nr:hypothetical protein LOK49_LG09G02394 [Camellia lanceoleosa]